MHYFHILWQEQQKVRTLEKELEKHKLESEEALQKQKLESEEAFLKQKRENEEELEQQKRESEERLREEREAGARATKARWVSLIMLESMVGVVGIQWFSYY